MVFEPDDTFVVTIRDADQVFGVGFLVGERYVLTCAHVVNLALGRPEGARERPDLDETVVDDTVQIEFTLLGDPPHPRRHARVVIWRPPGPDGQYRRMSDIAGLEFLEYEDPPNGVQPAELADAESAEVRIFGYPPGRPDGSWCRGILVRPVGSRLFQVNGVPGDAVQPQPGFSGAAVIDGSNRVVGMFAITSDGANPGTCYAIPPDWLRKAWPELFPSAEERSPRPPAERRQIKLGPTPRERFGWRRQQAVQGFREMPTPARLVTILGTVLGLVGLIAALIISLPGDDRGNCIPLVVSASTEKDELLGDIAEDYNDSSRDFDGKCAEVSVHGLSSGIAMEALADGWKTHPITQDPLQPATRPQVWLPTSSMWLGLLPVTQRARLLPKEAPRSVTRSVLGVAMPRRMAQAIRERYRGGITWEKIFELATNPAGWTAAGHSEWGKVALGRDNPHYSTSGLAATVATYFAATPKRAAITEQDLNDADVVKSVHDIESSVSQYSSNDATLFMEELYNEDRKYPDVNAHVPFVSAIVMQEQLAYLYNHGMPTGDINRKLPRPHEPMEMIYPSNGTLEMDHPYVVLADASEDQKDAAADFQEFLEDGTQQQKFIEHGFRARAAPERPTDRLVTSVAAPPGQRLSLTAPPAPNLVAKMRADWSATRKKARVRLVLDVSGSMKDSIDPADPESPRKLDQLKPAAKRGVDLLGDGDEAGIWTFASSPEHRENVPISAVQGAQQNLHEVIERLSTRGGYTALYRAMKAAHQDMVEDFDHERINAIILLTDGKNTPPNEKERQELIEQLTAENLDDSVRVFAISYGATADKALLAQIARVSKGSYYDASNPQNIDKVFASVFSNFVG